MHATADAAAVDEHEEEDQEEGIEDSYVVLSDWRTARTVRDTWADLFPRLDPLPQYVSRAQWAEIANHWGWVPPYLTTHAAHRQVMDIASVLHRLLGDTVRLTHILHGIAYRLYTTLMRHKRISTLAIVAQPLLETTQHRDTAWYYDLPSTLDQAVHDQTMQWAQHYIGIMRSRGIDTDDRALLSTIAIERLSDTISGITIESWPLAHTAERVMRKVLVPTGLPIYRWDWVGEELCR
jgi:hypothetical protein